MSTSLIDKDNASLLPGLVIDDLPAPLGDEELNQLPAYTAGRLFELDERKYKTAVALFFGEGLSVRGVCRICHISCHTLQAIIRRESHGQTAEAWRKVSSADIRASIYMIQRRIDELLQDYDAVKAAGIKGIATLLRESTHAHELLNQRLPGQVDAAKLTPEQQAKAYIEAQAHAHGQSIEVEESGEATRPAGDADAADQDGSEVSE